MRGIGVVVAVLLAAAPQARAQSASAESWGSGSAALGVGMFGDKPATTLDLGIDLETGELAVGVGGRVRWLAGDGVREEDWDEASEIATAIRYLTYRRAADGGWPGFAVAAGALADVRLGHGSLVSGYTSGLDVDRGHLGIQSRAAGDRYGVDAMLDDVVSPRIAAARGRVFSEDGASFGITVAGDLELGTPMIGVDAAWAARYVTPYLDLALIDTSAFGIHAGLAVDAEGGGARWLGSLEARAGGGGYIPGWLGPLYEIERETLADEIRMSDLGGIGGFVELGVDIPEVGRLTSSYSQRPGLADQVTVRAAAPHFRRAQLAVWAAADADKRGDRALAAELRLELPHRLFAAADAARLYRSVDGEFEPLWVATVAFGSALGF